MLTKIPVEELKPGMYVERLDRPWLDSPFPFQGVYLRTQDNIEQVKIFCKHVYIDGDEDPTSLFNNRNLAQYGLVDYDQQPLSPKSLLPRFDHNDRKLFVEAVEHARELYAEAKTIIEGIHEDVKLKHPIDQERVVKSVKSMVANVIRNPDALLWLTHLKRQDAYTAIHSLNVCILSLIFGHHIGLQEHELADLGLGALLHDIGKLRIPDEILDKPDTLSAKEYELMKKHPGFGVDFLRAMKDLPALAMNVVYLHHERFAGGGYPLGMDLNRETDLFTQIVSIIDFYDAVTSDRAYRGRMSSFGTIKLLQKMAGRNFHPGLTKHFVDYMGLYPSGSLVKMNTQEVGIVMPTPRRDKAKPIIMAVLDENGYRHHTLKIIDFKLFDFHESPYQIQQEHPNGAFGIDVTDYALEIPYAEDWLGS